MKNPLLVAAAIGVATLGYPIAASAAEYDVGPNKPFRSIGAVPWSNLSAGDTVRIQWRPEAYREKILITGRGTSERPIKVEGVPGPNGELPIIDGQNAVTDSRLVSQHPVQQQRGLLTISRTRAHPAGYLPAHIEISGLHFRNASMEHRFSDNSGQQREYMRNAAGIFVERGEQITIRGCKISGCGNGLFVASSGTDAISRDILVEKCHIFGNGNPGRDREHNVYTEALGITFQFNHLGRLRPGAGGNNLKDRSAGTVIRYNLIEGGAHLMDLVEAQEGWRVISTHPTYRQAWVYGNVLVNGPGDGNRIVHYGHDSSDQTSRRGVLYFHHNTVLVRRDQRECWKVFVFRLQTNAETADVRNNIFHAIPATSGPTAELTLMNTEGAAQIGVNWITTGYLVSRSGMPFTGRVQGLNNLIVGSDPGFVNLRQNDMRLKANSPAVNKAGPLAGPAADAHPPRFQYVNLSGAPRATVGGRPDLGAFEFGGESSGNPRASKAAKRPAAARARRAKR